MHLVGFVIKKIMNRISKTPEGLSSLTLNLLTTSIVAPPSNASEWQMGFNSAFKGLMHDPKHRQ